ncbi:MAG: response regulator transcription factor [Acidobacteria bacterium]|nr:response regulator transcription factor [Acidobacteriota bacterium]
MSRILIIEDEAHIAEGVRFNLELEGHQAEVAETGEAGVQAIQAASPPFDLLVLDVMLPGIDGFAVASQLRQNNWFQPILMLTARSRPEDVLQGFEAGADDYLAKPFVLAILLARVRSLLRRGPWQQPVSKAGVFEFGNKRFDYDNLEITANGRILRLTLMEANLLRYLIQRQGTVISRKMILDDVWEVHEDTDTRAIDNFIARLRKHVEDEPAQPRHLLTVRGVGYKFLANPS